MPDNSSANAGGDLRIQRAAGDPLRGALPTELGWIRDLYDIAGVPDSWQRFLARVCVLLDAPVAAIAIRVAGAEGNRLRALHVTGLPDAFQAAERRRQRANGGNAPLRVLPAITCDRLASTPIFSVSIERQDPDCLFKRLGVRHLTVARGLEVGDKLSFMTVGRTADQPAFGSSELDLLETLLPHFQHATQLADMLEQLRASVTASAAVLDMIAVGVVIFDEYGERALANEAAHKIFDADGGILRHLSAEVMRIRDAARSTNGQAPEARILNLTGQGRAQPLFAIIWDFPDESFYRRHKLVFLIDPAQEHNICIDLVALQRLYGLTSMESRVAALLAKGSSVAEIADQLGNTAYTIRTHLRHIFDKTGTARQVDLVHLLLRSLVALQIPTVPHHGKLRA
jgi:DNA-binding CsgD family transcriptional regulator